MAVSAIFFYVTKRLMRAEGCLLHAHRRIENLHRAAAAGSKVKIPGHIMTAEIDHRHHVRRAATGYCEHTVRGAGTIPCAHHARNEVDASEIDELVDVLAEAGHRAAEGGCVAQRIGDFQRAGAGGLEYDVLIVAGALDIEDAIGDLGDAAASDGRPANDIDEAASAAGEQRAGNDHGTAQYSRAADQGFQQPA
jgi:hypothetical protein